VDSLVELVNIDERRLMGIHLDVRERAVSYLKDGKMRDAYCVEEGDL
jgi:hypothetical protein